MTIEAIRGNGLGFPGIDEAVIRPDQSEIAMNTTMDGFLKHFNNVRQRTRRVVECIPDEHIEWAPREGMFTLGDLVRHIAVTERYIWAESVHNRPSAYVSHWTELAAGKPAVVSFFDRMHEQSLTLFRALPADALFTSCTTPTGAQLVIWKWLQMMVEHEVHHRGQLYSSLGCLGVATPSLYGLTSQEVASSLIVRAPSCQKLPHQPSSPGANL